MHVVRSRLLESSYLGQDLGTLSRKLILLRLGRRVAVEVVAAEAGTIGRGDTNLGVHVVCSRLLEGRRLGKDLGALIRVFVLLGLGRRVAVEVVAAEAGTMGRGDADLR